LNEAQTDIESNERLEFLGDTILSFVISEWLFERFPDYPEGNLTNIRSNLVRTASLAAISRRLGIGNHLLLSKGERESGGVRNPTLLANALEAIIGAISLDQDLKTVKKFIRDKFLPTLDTLIRSGNFKDSKSLLQEKIQAETNSSPVYKTLAEEGPDHRKTFTVGVFLDEKLLATGVGKSKQQAEEGAAQIALNAYEK
jgi:ribonuclease-3